MAQSRSGPDGGAPARHGAEEEEEEHGGRGVSCGPALSVRVDETCGRARALTLALPHGPVITPVFQPVGTKGTIKGVTTQEMKEAPISCQILLGNTYHLANQPGAEVIRRMGGLHKFMNWDGNILTDSGGFQMVSLLRLAQITEEGVNFQSPSDGTELMLTPEESIRTQHRIGSDIVMMLDDVIHSCTVDDARFAEATDRTIRWLDRCIEAHKRGGEEDERNGFKSGPKHQNLFAIVQGGLDVSPGGLRERCLAEMAKRDADIPGYAIGGLAGGESKHQFWRVVDKCCRHLPAHKPRYLMGVGHPLDIVVCSALGVDMYDSVFGTRTARFGTAFTPSGSIKLKHAKFAKDAGPIAVGCPCSACRPARAGATQPAFSRASLHFLLKQASDNGVASIVTHHNLVYLLELVRSMRQAILDDRYPAFVNDFLRKQFPPEDSNAHVPLWVCEALEAAEIALDQDLSREVRDEGAQPAE
ncbi:Queuine tRNA-ribosyltransferase catalytic subunit [Hondaea fermentalgiana]|uniref:Queuine tRNA-ribosyltransferase catalytic subunit 1 n=1 Tax=Hondaea fermentalgiana TaxID=2315210 RepID=A0A2R5GTU2_9STRA|nr:Queuine tRNA-ribosyltransferase catalytic subunit [Hondaea fermentalgiana]|eukprot:GBG31811.1 Queuine tRNA-ribosyltransferase catalytic subunit [Hondaea fermentalgiana]